MESWMVSAIIAVSGIIAAAAVAKYMIGELNRQVGQQWDRLDSHYKKIIEHEGILSSKPDMEDMRHVFVDIEKWKMSNQHVSNRLDKMEQSVLSKLDEIKSVVCPAAQKV